MEAPPNKRRPENREVSAQIAAINLLFAFTFIISLTGAWAVWTGSRLHELTHHHVEHTNELAAAIDQFRMTGGGDAIALRDVVLQVRQPSTDCLEIAGRLQRLVMQAAGTIEAIGICELDVALADSALQEIDEYLAGSITSSDLLQRISLALRGFLSNAAAFDPLVARTATTIFAVLFATVVVAGMAIGTLAYLIARNLRLNIQALEAAQKSEALATERLEAAVKGSNVGLWDWDTTTNALYWSPRLKEMFGLTDETFTGHATEWSDRLHPDDRDRTMAELNAHLETGRRYDVDFRQRHEDGHYLWLNARGQAVRDGDGNVVRIAGSVDDITRNIELQQQLEAQRAELRLIFDSVPARIWVKDEQNRIIRLNRHAAQSMGVTVDEAENAHSGDGLPGMPPESYEDDLKTIQAGEPKLGIVEPLSSGGQEHGWAQTDKVPFIDPLTGKRCLLVTSTDITELKDAEELLESQASELRRSNAELAKFAYVASHDLKAPLRAIDNLAMWIDEDLADGSDETRENISLMRGRIARLNKLLDDLLQYSRVGRQEHAVVRVDVDELVRGAVDLEAGEVSIHLRLPEPLPTIETVRAPLEQVFINLIGNAAKHCDQTEVEVTIRWEESDGMLHFEVADDGPGIEPEHHTRVFEMFQTLKPRDVVEGSGMGLAIIRKQIERVGGEIRVRSDPSTGRGTAFAFSWPRTLQA